jgi:Tetratricopeptide repeat/AAA domain
MMPDNLSDPQASRRDGLIITFYSYKGGTGRTMALANVAWILAANGKRVLVADWDLESPGLHRFYHPFLSSSEVGDASGVIDLIRRYEHAAANAGDQAAIDRLIPELAKVQPHVLPVNWEHFGAGGSLEFLTAGRQNLDYAETLAALDWDSFYERHRGGEFLDAVRADMKRHYDYVLIDSRTGLSDIAGICTIQLPDVLVDCFTLSIQGIEGAAQVARDVLGHKKPIRILPVPMRVDQGEKEKVDAGRAVAIRRFADLPGGLSEAARRQYWADVEVPYRAFYAYEETLAAFGDPPGPRDSLLASFERLTGQITGGAITSLPPTNEPLRIRTKLLFTRQTPLTGDEVTVAFCAQDQVWGEWIVDVLRAAGIPTHERQLDETLQLDSEPTVGRTLTVVSNTYLARYRALPSRIDAPALAANVTSARAPAEFRTAPFAVIAGVPELEAIEQLQRLVGAGNWRAAESAGVHRVRYPGLEPKINTAPVANSRFTGRERSIRQLREMLSESGPADVRPVVLQGIGGVGKTQVAIEYVHRFRTDYDIVWWMDTEQAHFIDASLVDLAVKLRDTFGVTVPLTANSDEVARSVLEMLAHGKEVSRWLLVYDTAEDIDTVRRYLPQGGGDVLITSRLGDWAEHARSLPLDAFTREESVTHLRKRIPTIDESDARQVAELLGDFPLAIATAGAWLKETGTAVASYVRELERRAPEALSYKHLDEYPKTLAETWELSLDRLAERSPAGARLFELCSVMAPNIALELLYSPAMAHLLAPLEPELDDPMIIGRLIHEIDRLALIKLDLSTDQVRIHRLVQLVVRDRMSPDQIVATEREVHEVLAATRPSRGIDNQETWDRYRMIWPHLTYSNAKNSISEPVRELLIDRLRYLWLRHALELANEFGEEVDEAWVRLLSQLAEGAETAEPASADTLRRQLLHLRSAQANILRDLARFTEAKELDESVLAEQRTLLGRDHPRTLSTAGGLAADLRALGRYREALAMDEITYRAWTERYGDGHPQSLRAANNLAVCYRLTGDIYTALRLDEETFDRYSASLGPVDRRTLISAFNVVRDLIEAGQYAEAASRMDLFVASTIECHGADSVEAMNAHVLLAMAQRGTGQPALAERNFEIALDLAGRIGNSMSSDALTTRLAHAVNLLDLNRAADAEREIRQVRAVYERRLGRSHPLTLICQLDFACALRTVDPDEALRTARVTVDGLLDALGGSHPYTLAALSVTGALLADAGQFDHAEEIETKVVEGLTRALGRKHPDTLGSLANLLITREKLGIPDAADVRAERERVVEDLARVIGYEHTRVKELRAGRRLMHTLNPQPF